MARSAPRFQARSSYGGTVQGFTRPAVSGDTEELKKKVMKYRNEDLKGFVEQGSAAIEPSTKGRSIDLYSSMPPDDFVLVRPEPKKKMKKKTAKPDSTAERQKPRPKKRRREPEVDPRQLVLLDYLPEGEA